RECRERTGFALAQCLVGIDVRAVRDPPLRASVTRSDVQHCDLTMVVEPLTQRLDVDLVAHAVLALSAGKVSVMRTAATTPETKVSAAIVSTAAVRPTRSAVMPASSAPRA